MLSVYQTLSVRYMSKRWVRVMLIVASIALGVATLVATQALNDTMTTASLARVNPMPGVADFVVSYGQLPISSDLANTLKQIDGVEDALPRIFDNLRIPDLDNRTVLLIGIDFKKHKDGKGLSHITLTEDKSLLEVLDDARSLLDKQFKTDPDVGKGLRDLVKGKIFEEKTGKLVIDYLDDLDAGKPTNGAVGDLVQNILPPVMVGEELVKDFVQIQNKERSLSRALSFLNDGVRLVILNWITNNLPEQFTRDAEQVLSHRIVVQKSSQSPSFNLLRVGTVKGEGHFSVLGGNIIILDIEDAARVLEMEKGKVSRIDVTLRPGANKEKVLAALKEAAKGHGTVRTPQEQAEAMGSALQGMRIGFSLCGLAALVVGLFLVYNALSVCVAERRHEIGVLLSLGATQRQIRLLFAGEAAFLGLTGSLLGIPLGIGLAFMALQPMQEILKDVFVATESNQVDVSWQLMLLALTCGLTTAVAAGLIPAMAASRENPASAVRQVSKAPTWGGLSWQIFGSLGLLGAGAMFSWFRKDLNNIQNYWSGISQSAQNNRLGIYGGMILVLLGALLAAPLLAALIARIIQPLARKCFPITWRLAADNLVLSPGRTGLVIAALSAGVALVTMVYGIIVSNRTALRDWVKEAVAADLIVSLGSPIGAGQSDVMTEALGEKMRKIKGIEKEGVLPMRKRKIDYRDIQVLLFAFDAGGSSKMEKKRQADLHRAMSAKTGEKEKGRSEDKEIEHNLKLYKTLSETPNAVIVSENFSALHGVRKGDFLTLDAGSQGEVEFMVIGTLLDYSWNKGTIFIDRARYKELWKDNMVDLFDVFVESGADLAAVQDSLRMKLGEPGLVVLTRQETQNGIEDLIERLYSVALSQLFVVKFVAFLGVVMALLISVLQRRREMGLLRAIGASRNQVVRSVLAEACLMGIIGTLIGLAVGIPLQYYLLRVVILEESGYLFPVLIPWFEGLVIALVAMITATLAGLGPALHSVRMRIPEAIAYE